jgi:hypothetical protein
MEIAAAFGGRYRIGRTRKSREISAISAAGVWRRTALRRIGCPPPSALAEKDVVRLAEHYGIIIRDPICGPGMPVPDLVRLDSQ